MTCESLCSPCCYLQLPETTSAVQGEATTILTPRVVVNAPPEPAAPKRHIGVIASGGDVVASKEQIRIYLTDWPKLIGVEMEGGGVAAGLHDDIARPRFLMIRGVSDLANGEDNAAMKKAWRAHACHVAAAYAVGLLRDGPVQAGPRSTTQNPR